MGIWVGLDRAKLGIEDRTGRIGWLWYLEPNHELALGLLEKRREELVSLPGQEHLLRAFRENSTPKVHLAPQC